MCVYAQKSASFHQKTGFAGAKLIIPLQIAGLFGLKIY